MEGSTVETPVSNSRKVSKYVRKSHAQSNNKQNLLREGLKGFKPPLVGT